jgi:hypothetical protein
LRRLLPYRTHCAKTQICDYDAEEVFELLNCHEQYLTLLSEFRSKASVKMLRNLSMSQRRGPFVKLTEGLGLTEAGIKVPEDIG